MINNNYEAKSNNWAKQVIFAHSWPKTTWFRLYIILHKRTLNGYNLFLLLYITAFEICFFFWILKIIIMKHFILNSSSLATWSWLQYNSWRLYGSIFWFGYKSADYNQTENYNSSTFVEISLQNWTCNTIVNKQTS